MAKLDAMIDAFMRVISRDGWTGANLEAIAREADCSVSTLVSAAGGRFDLLDAFGKRATVAALKEAEDEGGSQAIRDRLFAILMARFDALQSHRAAIRKLAEAAPRDPALALHFACAMPATMRLLADAAGVPTTGVVGAVRVKALTALYLNVARTWLSDDSEDMAKTMKALDENLARAHRW